MTNKKDWDIKESVRDDSISLNVIEGHRLAVCELAKMIEPESFGLPSGEWFFFSRLNVPERLRGRGIGSALMSRLVELLDEHQLNVVNEINPYGRESDMGFKELKAFYEKYGFSQEGEFFVRHPKEPCMEPKA